MIWFAAFVSIFAVLLATVLANSGGAKPNTDGRLSTQGRESTDLLVFGGTPSGVAAAVSAARMGLKVKLVSPTGSIGGAIANGVSATDGLLYEPTGFAREFFDRADKFYKHNPNLRIEPHVAEAIFMGLLQKANVQVQINAKLAGVEKLGDRIECLRFERIPTQCAATFVDASYEGDLFAVAGARYRLGTEDLFAYGESLAKKRIMHAVVRMSNLSPIEVGSLKELPFTSAPASFEAKNADLTLGMPSFTYRLCLSKTSKVAFRPSLEYKKWIPAWRILMRSLYADGTCAQCVVAAHGTVLTKLWRIAELPNKKYDLNSHLGLTNFPIPRSYFGLGKSRHRINQLALDYMQSLIYWLQTDPTAPAYESKALEGMGLCADEYRGNRHLPYQPYVREGRRVVGEYTITAFDLFHNRKKPDAIAYGSYFLDNKSSQLVFADNAIYRDKTPFLLPPAYEIPYRVMVPKFGPENLLVSVGVSSSPISYGSIRMEQQFMGLGQAAGIAAAVAVRTGRVVAKVDVSRVQAGLARVGARVRLGDLCAASANASQVTLAGTSITCARQVSSN
jgi:hypothetical protein